MEPKHSRTPTPSDLRAAAAKRLPDVIAPRLDVLFCGINPSLYSAAVGCHFGRPGNRFWPVLHRAGFTPRRLSPFEQQQLLDCGCGITNLVARATAKAADLSVPELESGARSLRRKLGRYRPRVLAVLGIDAFRAAWHAPHAATGRQAEQIAGVAVWVLPNPSGANARYTLDTLVAQFRALRRAVD
jgi:double-stranded uracil-DNA glycosylase